MGGVEQTVANGVISIGNVTGDIVITASATSMSYTTISSDFQSNDWSINIPTIDFANGDCIAMEINLSNAISYGSDGMEVASFGTNIGTWASNGNTDFFWYCSWVSTATDDVFDGIDCVFQETVGGSGEFCGHTFKYRGTLPVTVIFALNKDGMWLNGELIDTSTGSISGSKTHHATALANLLALTTIDIGVKENTTGPELNYNWIRLYSGSEA